MLGRFQGEGPCGWSRGARGRPGAELRAVTGADGKGPCGLGQDLASVLSTSYRGGNHSWGPGAHSTPRVEKQTVCR